MNTAPGEIYTVAISHGEGRFVAPEEVMADLITRGQVATQYVDLEGNPTSEVGFNPNNPTYAVEGVTSPDGRVLARWGTPSASGKGCTRMSRVSLIWGCSPARCSTSVSRGTSTADPAQPNQSQPGLSRPAPPTPPTQPIQTPPRQLASRPVKAQCSVLANHPTPF